MKNKNWRIAALIGVVAIFGARIYMSFEKKKDQEKQQQMIEDLARMQSEEFRHRNTEYIDSLSQAAANVLSEQQGVLDSISKKMKAEQEELDAKMKKQ